MTHALQGNRKGDDTDCRMDYVRLIVDMSHVVEDGSSLFLLRRDHGSLVPYIRSLIMALPGNHTMQLASEASRWRRKVQLWKMAKESPGGTTVSVLELQNVSRALPISRATY